jgi:hypothetical protein
MYSSLREANLMVNQSIASPRPDVPGLIERLRDAIRRRLYSYRTEQAYVYWVRRFIALNGSRNPVELGKDEVSAFVKHLARDRAASAATQKQVLAALLFFYSVVLGKELPGLRRGRRGTGVRARQPRAEYRVAV